MVDLFEESSESSLGLSLCDFFLERERERTGEKAGEEVHIVMSLCHTSTDVGHFAMIFRNQRILSTALRQMNVQETYHYYLRVCIKYFEENSTRNARSHGDDGFFRRSCLLSW